MGNKLSQVEFEERVRAVHGEKYDLSKARYIGALEKVEVVCPEHGSWEVTPSHLFNGTGCPKCAGKNVTQEEFEERARKAHGDKYDLSKAMYQGDNKKKVEVICPEHGPWWITPNSFLRGRGCRKCSGYEKLTQTEFERRVRKIHGEKKYDLSRAEYIDSFTKVEIVCYIHGSWWVNPNNLFNGRGCPKCAGKGALTQYEFEEKFRIVHDGRKYDLSESVYERGNKKVKVICPDHGAWWAIPNSLLGGRGCPKCGIEKRAKSKTLDQAEFERRIYKLFGDKADCSKAVYKGHREKVTIRCTEHDVEFETAPGNLFEKYWGCPKCSRGVSVGENEVADYLESFGLAVERGRRDVISPFELDIFIPEKNLAVEYNGVYYHNDQRKPRNYHRDKYLACKDKGVRLIQFTDIAWETRQDQIKSLLANALGVRTNEKKIDARKCEVRQVNVSELKDFYDTNHIQGHCRTGSLALALFSGSEIVAGIVFGKGTNRRGKARIGRNGEWTLSRYATNCVVRGGFQKLLKHGRGLIGWEHDIISFSMLDLFSGKTYKAAGFELDAEIGPDYQVYHPRNGLRPKSHWQRRMIPKRLQEIGWEGSFDPETDPRTEWQLEDEVGAVRVWDSGKIRWRLRGVDK